LGKSGGSEQEQYVDEDKTKAEKADKEHHILAPTVDAPVTAMRR
jgi:hypothetical protein